MGLAHILVPVFAVLPAIYGAWPRFVPRSVDCSVEGECKVQMHDAENKIVPCRYESSARGSRFACPLGCPTAPRLSAVLKEKSKDYQKCIQFHTYSKEKRPDDWYMWVKPICVSNITTWCQYNDVVVGRQKIVDTGLN